MTGNTKHRLTAGNYRRGLSRTVALFVSAVCLTGQLLVVAHEATERHVLCAEHGELTHVRVGLAWSPARSHGDALDAQAEAAPGHDHCGFVAHLTRQQLRPILLVSAAPEPAPRLHPAPPPVVPPEAELILLSAPKIAPPV